jgi:hypothetical protein
MCAFFDSGSNVAWVEHNSDASTDRLRRQIASEAAPNYSIASVASANLAPVDFELTLLVLGDEGHPLSQVKLSISSRVATSDFN